MPQVIKTNIYSLDSQRQLDRSQTSLGTALQRLSSGLRINTAKDDAAGLAISERMSAQISGLDTARRNANDGVSLSQTAESALSTIGEMLRRIRDLAVQSANATNSDSDRQALNEEVTQLKMEIDRIGNDTNFNNRILLDGSFTNQYFQIGANAGQVTIVNLTDSRAISIGAQFSSETKTMTFGNSGPTLNNEYGFEINGVRITVKQTAVTGDFSDLKNAINRVALQTNVQAEYTDPTDPTSGLTLKGASFDVGNFMSKNTAGSVIAADLPTISPQLVGTFPAPAMDNGNAGTNGIVAQTLSIYGSGGTELINIADGDSGQDIAATINGISHLTGVEASARTITYLAELGGDGIVGFKIYGTNATAVDISADCQTTDLTNLAKAVNDVADRTGITAVLSIDKTEIKLVSEDGADIVIEDFFSSNPTVANQTIVVRSPVATGDFASQKPTGSEVQLTGGTGTDSTRVGGRVYFNSEKGFRLETSEAAPTAPNGGSLLGAQKVYPAMISIAEIDISTREGADTAILSVDAALTSVNSNRAKLGAVQNRFEAAISNLQAVSENLSAARSRIRDADYAAETSNMATAQIIQQAGISMLTQANALPRNVLSLLQGG